MPSKILLVDDDPEFREEFREYFDDFEFIEAGNGKEALETLRKPNEIDLVILDVRMPGMDGLEVLSRIREIAPDVGIIISTGYSTKDTAIEAFRNKADNYLEKPLDIEATREIIDKVLDSKKGLPDFAASDITDKIVRVKYFIEKNCFKKVTLEDAAAAVCLSPKYLSRVFKEQTRRGFNDYKLAIKMDKAKDLLLETGYNVNQVSDRLGYENVESFIRQFKKMAKTTPSAYRRKTKNKRKGK
ncbi:MAG: response regulator [bacterium]|nr:response regulator [bacterium]MDD5756735.1 response regulator [bacterium]